jgi:hypothetical protein
MSVINTFTKTLLSNETINTSGLTQTVLFNKQAGLEELRIVI